MALPASGELSNSTNTVATQKQLVENQRDAIDFIQKTVTVDIAADEDLTLSDTQNLYGGVTITDTGTTLTGDINVIVAGDERKLTVTNSTDYGLTFKSELGTGVSVPPGATKEAYFDDDVTLRSIQIGVEAAQLAGVKNYIINGGFSVNQRAYVSGTATSGANEYTLDRWRVATSGQSLTFSDSNGTRTVTAPAGGIEQVIEGTWIQSGTYNLSWTGTATATVNGVARTSGESFSITGGSNITIKFSGGTVSNAQFEKGPVTTPFEHRPYGMELSLCQRYLPVFSGELGTGAALNSNGAVTATDKRYIVDLKFPVETRVPPTGYTISSVSHFQIGEGITINEAAVSSSFGSANTTFALIYVNGSTTTTGKEGYPSRFYANNANARLIFEGCEL